jgi:hypothetical protein
MIKPTQWEVVEGELETNGMYRVCGTTGSSKAKRIKNEQPTPRITTFLGAIAECSSVSDTYCYLELAALIPVDINFHSLSLPHLSQ